MLSPHSPGLVQEFLLIHVGVKSVTKGKNWLTLSHLQLTVISVCSQVTWYKVEDKGVAASARLLV